jgi:uncharacterized membrane protein
MPFGLQSTHVMILVITSLLCILPLLIVGVGVYIMVSRSLKSPSQPNTYTPLETLKMRYAKGEITEEQFHKMKSDLFV